MTKKINLKTVTFEAIPHHIVGTEVLRVFIKIGNKKAELFHLNSNGILDFGLYWNAKDLKKIGLPTEQTAYGEEIPIINGLATTDLVLRQQIDDMYSCFRQIESFWYKLSNS